ncbi:MAG: hypothetical protein ABH952_00810 [Candidatus Omnitrophota bacterium]
MIGRIGIFIVIFIFALAGGCERQEKAAQPSAARIMPDAAKKKIKRPAAGNVTLSAQVYGREDPFAPITKANLTAQVETTKDDYALEGILWDETQPLAIIDGLIVKQGDKIFSKVVVRIEEDKVILKQGDREEELWMHYPR